MELNELKRRLRKLSRALREECTAINYGGCAVMAGIVGELLQAQGVAVEVVTPATAGYNTTPREVREQLQAEYWGESWSTFDWDDYGLCRSHLAVRFEVDGRLYTWDSDGLVCSNRYFGIGYNGGPEFEANYPFGDGLTVQECTEMAGKDFGWNTRFDRDQIPRMRELAEKYLQP